MLPVVVKDGIEQPWMPLKLDISLANTPEQIDSNIESALRRDYIPFTDLLDKESGAVSIIGSGPSLIDTWQDIKGDILACNASNQFLLERGIVPKYVMIFDADILADEFVTTPHKDITYLLASRCHPKLFDMLEGYKVVVWHASGDLNVQDILERNGVMEPMCGGGGASVTRAMFLVQTLGYRHIHLFGSDSSYVMGYRDTHIRRSTTVEKHISIGCNGRVFDTTPWMAAQAEDFKVLVPSLQRLGLKVTVHGDGLIPHIARGMNLDVDGESRLMQLTREAKLKARTLWQNL